MICNRCIKIYFKNQVKDCLMCGEKNINNNKQIICDDCSEKRNNCSFCLKSLVKNKSGCNCFGTK